MGKRRKPVRKPNYQSLDEARLEGMRMASDELRYLTEEIPGKELGPAYERLLDITDKMNQRDQMFIDAGVPASEFRGFQQLQVPQLSNGVPAPYVDTVSKPGLERRVHTQVMQNPKTGGNEITPMSNPETKQALVTEFGDGRGGNIDGLTVPPVPTHAERPKIGDRASEYLGKRIAWLQGDKNAKLINATDYSVPDMEMGDGRGVDIHTLRTGVHDGVVEVQVNTGVNPTVKPRAGIVQETAIKQMIMEKVRGGASLPEAINALKGDTRTGLTPVTVDGRDVSAGKLYKEGYNGLISPLFDRNEALLNVYTEVGRNGKRLPARKQDKTVIKPEKIFNVDLNELRQPIEEMTSSEVDRGIRLSPNYGNDGSGKRRTRINMLVPTDTPGVRDISMDGYVAQLLKQLPYQ